MNKLKKLVINFIKIILISSPIIFLIVYFCITFTGPIHVLNVDQTNIAAISEALSKDNIKVDNLNDVNKIEVCGARLWDYDDLYFYYDNNKRHSTELYHNEHYYIEDYLEENCFDVDPIFFTSIFISLSTIFFSIYTNKKNEKRDL